MEAGHDGDGRAVIEVALEAFVNNARARRAALTPGQLAQLAQLAAHGVERAVVEA